MPTAKAALVYGLTIRSSALFFAADVWTRLSPSLPFFDLVFLRRSNGGLVSKGGGGTAAVTKVPNEVWEVVRHWLVQEELTTSEITLVDPFTSTSDCEDPFCSSRMYQGKRIRWEEFCDLSVCHDVAETRDLFTIRNIANWNVPLISQIGMEQNSSPRALLADFGLGLPLNQPINVLDERADTKALALIAAPSALLRGKSPAPVIDALCLEGRGHDDNTLVDVSF